ncbi:DUF6052 family protein [Amycolatopsis roodepoortensis]|uniref:DUF6052 family protein n=1 Tax=Amycolatopsis roodepoortensis TaxID=700274 RepID=UPI00214C6CA9|nr:DUF6052 family protein [Amycolatopsis roodepoortensis]UUV29032.1 DUF6052 family protein [Amycolatopsis roodepoortensis]
MTNATGELSAEHRHALIDTYLTLHELAIGCAVPSVRAAARAAVAEVHAALDGQAIDFEFYSHRWVPADPTEGVEKRCP